jgi:hypothetical protein
MTTLVKRRRGLLVLGCVASLVLLAPALAGASKPAGLRVVEPDRGVLAEHTQYTGAVRITTDPRADCFGAGTGGSGAKVQLGGATALGLVKDGLRADRDLRPLSVTDAFAFGLGVCGIGGFEAPPTGFWYVKHNHAGALVGADQVSLDRGDEVLWYLISDFTAPLPAELTLAAAPRTGPGPVEVTAYQYADDGTRTPAPGVRVSVGGSAAAGTAAVAAVLTDGDGRATVTAVGEGRLVLRATREADIPAAKVRVCVSERLGECARVHGEHVFGSGARDRITATRGDDVITPLGGRDVVRARGGDDLVKARRGGRDRIDCGGGFDVARVDRADRVRNCERVQRR